MSIVFTSTLVGLAAEAAHAGAWHESFPHIHHLRVHRFALRFGVAPFSLALPEVAIATSVLSWSRQCPSSTGSLTSIEGHILIQLPWLMNAMLLIILYRGRTFSDASHGGHCLT